MNSDRRWAGLIVSGLSVLGGCGGAQEAEPFDSNRAGVSECSDPYGTNDSMEQATRLNDMSDSEGEEWIVDPRLWGEGAEDWYVFEVQDDSGSLQPTIVVDLDDDAQPTYRAIETCLFSTLPAEDVACAIGTPWTHDGLAGCCSDRSPRTSIVSMDLGTALYDDTSDVYVRIQPVDAMPMPCTRYWLGYKAHGTE